MIRTYPHHPQRHLPSVNRIFSKLQRAHDAQFSHGHQRGTQLVGRNSRQSRNSRYSESCDAEMQWIQSGGGVQVQFAFGCGR